MRHAAHSWHIGCCLQVLLVSLISIILLQSSYGIVTDIESPKL